MELVRISANAEGYYSGQTYEENIFITKESYEKLEDEINKIEIYIGELDGKHSEVEADVTTDYFTEQELLEVDLEKLDDGNNLRYDLENIFNENNINFKKELKQVYEYLSTLDVVVTFEVKVKKSQKEDVLRFIKNLKQERDN